VHPEARSPALTLACAQTQPVSATISEDRQTLTFAVLNPSDSEQRLKLSVSGARLSGRGHLWRMAPPKVDATITVGQEPGVQVDQSELTSVPDTMSVPPFSVSLYSFPVQ